MSVNIKITLNGDIVTHLVDFDTFPEWFEESMKGDGYFEFEVKPFVFTLITIGTSIAPSRGDWVIITDSSNGQQLLKGKIDEILNADSNTPEITVFPQALILKDAIVGDSVALLVEEDIEYVKQYFFGVSTLKNILTRLLNEVNAVHGSDMFVTSASVPVSEIDPNDNYVGNLLQTFTGFGGTLAEALSSIYVRESFGDYYLIHHQNSDYYVWRMEGGELIFQDTYDSDLGFGDLIVGETAENVSSEEIIAVAIEHGIVSDHVIRRSFDYDSQTSYALVFGKRNSQTDRFEPVLLSFTTTYDDEFTGKYQNMTAMEIIRDLAVVSNRWFYVDRTGLVYLLPRASSRGSISLTTGKTLSAIKKIRAEQDTEIQVNTYQEDDNGKVTSWGLIIRESRLESIKLSYRVLFSSDITEWTLEMYDSIGDDILKEVSWDMKSELPTIGKVISIAHSLLDRRQKAVIEYGL